MTSGDGDKGRGEDKVGGRHASPLWIQLLKLGDRFAAVQTTLDSTSLRGDWSQLEREGS